MPDTTIVAKNNQIVPAKPLVAYKTDLAAETYALLDPQESAGLLEVLNENIGPAGIATLDLPRIKVPSGGALQWQVTGLEGEEYLREIEGIVLAWRSGRIYWKNAYGEGGGKKPPDCTSTDGFLGIGDPGGECAKCPYAQFGSAAKGSRGQACKQMRQLLLVRPGEILPHLISVPPTSLKAASGYFYALTARRINYWAVITKIKLERASNEDGIAYAKMSFQAGRRLNDAEQRILAPFHYRMAEMLSPIPLEITDYTVVTEEDAPPEEGYRS